MFLHWFHHLSLGHLSGLSKANKELLEVLVDLQKGVAHLFPLLDAQGPTEHPETGPLEDRDLGEVAEVLDHRLTGQKELLKALKDLKRQIQ